MANHMGGNCIVPGYRGGSANSEFEMLTGMSMSFLPFGTCPYLQYLKQDIPSLPRLLKRHGYRTVAIQCTRPSIYNYHFAYQHLGFDQFLSENDLLPHSTLIRGAISDQSVVDAVLASLPARPDTPPTFVLAFPATTHGPYNYPDYRASDLDFTSAPTARMRASPLHDELKAYVNAISHADKALPRLFLSLQARHRRTVVVIVGDHLPPFDLRIFTDAGYDDASNPEVMEKRYRTPMAIWSNFGLSGRLETMSLNHVPGEVLRLVGIKPEGLFAATNRLKPSVPILSTIVKSNGRLYSSYQDLPAETRSLVHQYRLLQYEMLFRNSDSLTGASVSGQ